MIGVGLGLKMSSKKVPVRIGLTKKPADVDTSDLLSSSTMEALQDIIDTDIVEVVQESQDQDEFDPDEELVELPDLEDEIERDIDPDYVPEVLPSTSTGVKGKRLLNRPQMQPKRSLNLINKDNEDTPTASAQGKGRSSAPIWAYFIVSDRKIAGGQISKGAECIVDVGGVPCGKRIMQNGSSTTGLNQHLERRHPKEFTAYKKAQATLQAERLSTKRTLVDHFEDLEGE